jgi:hypothetical protein
MIHQFVQAIAGLLGPPPAEAKPAASPAPHYSVESSWACLPGRSDACSTPLATTELNAHGYGSTGQSAVAANPRVDCFYVYPTMSNDTGPNSDLKVSEELVAIKAQFTRFASVCRTFAPIYRQMTLAHVAVAEMGGDVLPAARLAYSDVARAWSAYLDRYNQGRPFVLIGHSQGSLMIQELIKREIEGRPVARRMVRAIIPGYDLLVPQGKRVGGTFKSTPLCSRRLEIGCAMSWVSYREGASPPEGARFGYAPPGMTVACTNPANPGSAGWETFDSYWPARSSYPVVGGPIRWASEGAAPSPFLRTEGLVAGKCVQDGRRGYLALRTISAPGGKRTDRIPGEVGVGGFFLPGWGMHLADMSVAQGDLVRSLGEISARFETAPRPER